MMQSKGTTIRPFLWILLVVVLILFPILLTNEYWLNVTNLFLLSTVMLMSLDFIFGVSGQLSLCHGTFMGIAAYSVAYLVSSNFASFWLAGLVGISFVLLTSMCIGALASKLKEFYLAVATLGFGLSADVLLTGWTSVTGGPQGLTIGKRPFVFGVSMSTMNRYYYLCLGLFMLTLFVMRSLSNSRTGLSLKCIMENEDAATSVGVNVAKHKWMCFMLGSVIAGFVGVLYMGLNLYINPGVFGPLYSFMLLASLIVGGTRSTLGPIIGAFVLVVMREQLYVFKEYKVFIYSALMFFFLIFMPEGISGYLVYLRNKVFK
jgi:branched-chain amino acid transport system permease protein